MAISFPISTVGSKGLQVSISVKMIACRTALANVDGGGFRDEKYHREVCHVLNYQLMCPGTNFAISF